MLGKLLKYEFKATGRTFIPVYIGILLIALINRGSRLINIEAISNITGMILGALFVALIVLTIIVIVQRFHKNLLTDEGYLMFTLPVKTETIIGAKLITAVVWGILSIIVAAIAGLILSADAAFFEALGEFIQIVLKTTPNSEMMRMITYLFVLLGTMLATYISMILLIYLSLAIPQIAKISKHKVAASFVSFFVLNTIITNIGVKVLGEDLLGRFTMQVGDLMFSGFVGLYYIVVGVIFFIATNYILKKHLNLQ